MKSSSFKALKRRPFVPLRDPNYESQIATEVLAETEAHDFINGRFTYVIFVSKSKGKNRKRSHITEVELISDKQECARRFYSWNRFPFDTKATDVYADTTLDGLEAEARLMREIPLKAKRG